MTKDNGSSTKDDKQYEVLKDRGLNKSEAEAVTQAKEMDYDSTPYEARTKEELYQKAADLHIKGRSDMNKTELIEALKNK